VHTDLADILRKLGGEHPLFLMKGVISCALTEPVASLLTEPWARPGHAPFSIDP
jgi:hypothetical protein